MALNFHESLHISFNNTLFSNTPVKLLDKYRLCLNSLFPFLLFFLFIPAIHAQEVDSCPCENCPALIEDGVSYKEFQLNIFNVQNNSLANSDQCVRKVGVKFTHEYSGDLLIELVSPGGDTVKLIGPVTFSQGATGQTDNRTFDIAFVGNDVTAEPDDNYDAKFSNDQNWAGQGVLEGTYYPFQGALADFDEGSVNGSWTLRVGDFNTERNDEGELLDFYVEFCDSEGLVCDPCLDPEDSPDCIFRIDAGEAIVVPDEIFCLPIYAENVAFLTALNFPMTWNEKVLEFNRVDSFQIENLRESDFDLMNVATGNLALSYNHTFDTLGLVVADSTPIFNVCFKAIGAVGDSSQINFLFPPIARNVDGDFLMTDSIIGTVIVSVDSTADCVNAIQLCGDAPVSIDKTKGTGFDDMEGCSPSGQEFQSKWFRFDVLESGDFEFMVQPKGMASFTYALYKDTCPSSGNDAVACEQGMPSEEGRIIGLSDDAAASFGDLGSASSRFSPSLGVNEGETYFLLIDNFSNNGVGFDLTFAGTAKIGDETLQVKIADPSTLNCTNPTIRLDATQSTQGSRYLPTWTTDVGTIDFSQAFYQPLITLGGTFTLAIEDTRSGCVVKDSVFVNTDMEFPEAIVSGGGTLDCTAPTLILNSVGASIGNNFAIKWSNLDTAIPDLPTNSELSVDVAGDYELAITNIINGCVTKDTTNVSADFTAPQLTAADNFISCFDPLATLLATSTTDNVEYEWTGGNLATPEVSAEILVNDTGMFLVQVRAPNGCITTDEVFVRDDRVFPVAEAGATFQLNCDNPTYSLDGNASSTGTAFQYNWSTDNGHFLPASNPSTISPTIDSGGLYILEVTNTTNGCVSLDSVQIDTSFTQPFIRITGETIITCFEPELVLDASSSDSGTIFQFDWFGENGNILTDADTYRPTITQVGNYIFNIKNTQNGCASSRIRNITSDADFPLVDAGPSDILSCNKNFVILDGTASSKGSQFDYKWTTADGNIIAETTGISAATDTEGTYTLTVSNRRNGCSEQDTVRIFENFVKPAIIIPPDTILTCENPSLLLIATSVTENTDFKWQLPDGDTTLTPSINVMNTGTYFITVTGENGCINFGEVEVTSEQEPPVVRIQDPELLTCLNQSVTIIGDQSDQGPNLAILWSTTDGLFAQDSQAVQINPVVTKGGTYLLTISNTRTGCVTSERVEVPSSQVNPQINIVRAPEIFTCANQSIPIEVNSDVGDAEIQWKLGSDVLFVGNTFEATAPGIYSILVINPANNCSTLSTVEVMADTIVPMADAGLSQELNCSIGKVTLDGSLSDQGNEFAYIWNAPNNEVFSDAIQIEASAPGLYNLIVVNQNNGCRTIDTVRVTEARDNPIADAGKDTVYCTGAEFDIVVGGNSTSQGANFEYSWQDGSETILGTTIRQRIEAPDTFLLKVVNTDNQCESLDSVIVFERRGPVVTLEQDGAINCATNEITYLATSDIPTSTIKWFGRFETPGSELTVTDTLLNEEFVAIAEDTLTGCLGQSVTVRVIADTLKPLLDAGEDTKVNCADTLRLAGQSLNIAIESTINWRTTDGNIVGSKNELTPIVDEAGTYILRIENTQNFCVSEDTVIVSTDQILPVINLGEDVILTCKESILTINPDTISKGPNFYYFWKDESGKIVAETDTLLTDFAGIYQLTVIDSSNLCTESDVIAVFDSINPPFIEIDVPELLTCVNNQVILNANTNLVAGTFQWTILSDTGHILGSANSPDLLVDSAGTYQLEVTNDFSGCQGAKNITVLDIRDSLKIEAGPNKTITCFNDTTVLAAGAIFSESESLSYIWTASSTNFVPIDTSLIFTIAERGTYYLQVMDTISKCEAIDSFLVDKDIAAVDYAIGETLVLDCTTEAVIVGDLEDPGQENYAYSWTTADGNISSEKDQPLAMATKGGLYELFIQDIQNGCTTTDTQRVVENIMLPNIDIGNAMLLTCENDQITIGGENTVIGENYLYEWTTLDGTILAGENTPFATINEGGNYEFSVLDTTNQCQSTASILINADKEAPIVSLPTGLNIDCTDNFIDITPTTELPQNSVAVAWSTENGELLSEAGRFIAQAGMPGTYFIAVMDTSNSCVTLDTVAIIDNRQLPEVASLENRMLGCENTSITINAQGSAIGENIGYAWMDATGRTLSNNTTVMVNIPGNYILQVTDRSNSCMNSDTVLITENINPPTSAIFAIESPSCDGIDNGYIEVANVIGGTPPYRYTLAENEPNLTTIFPDLAPNTYQLSITDELACTWDTTIILSQPEIIQATIEISDDDLVTGELATFSVSTSIPASDIVDIQWSPADLFACPDCNEVSTFLTNNTTIDVAITDINGCESYASLAVEVALANVPNAITPNGDGMNDFFIVPQIERNPDAYPESELIIFNRWGDVLFKISPYDNNWDGRNNKGESIVEGTYYYVLRLNTREGEFMKGDITVIRR